MKILLFGEFSGLHKFLKDGLCQLGDHEVTLIADGDGWKQIPGADKTLPVRKGNNINSIISFIKGYSSIFYQLQNYDVVQYINATFCYIFFQYIIQSKIKKLSKCISLQNAGVNNEEVKLYKAHIFKHSPFDYDGTLLSLYDQHTSRGKIRIFNEETLAKQVDIIIPSLYCYSLGYIGKNMYDIIPFPINLDGLNYQPNIVKKKVCFFHGYRGHWKGSHLIQDGLLRLQEKYPNDVEVIVNRQMPYDEYVQAMQRANVVLDQCTGNGYGINTCLSMAQGKVTMVSIDPKFPSIKANVFPMIPIEPDVDQIYSQLEFVLENRDKIEQWGYESRKYVETYHECKMIAQKYVDAWKSTGKI